MRINDLNSQLFPDQNVYEPADPNLSALNNTINAGTQWIATQASVARMYVSHHLWRIGPHSKMNRVNKPAVMTGFGLVTQNNAPFFIPFNSSSITFPNSSNIPQTLSGPSVGILQGQAPVNDSAQALIYEAWLEAAIANGISGSNLYQWGQANLQPAPPVPTEGFSPASPSTETFSPALPNTEGTSPNDGYQAYVSSPHIYLLFRYSLVSPLESRPKFKLSSRPPLSTLT